MRRALGAAVLALIVAACGSTVQIRDTATSGLGGSDGLGSQGSTGSALPGTTGNGAGASQTTAGTAAASGAGATSSTGGAPSSAGGPGAIQGATSSTASGTARKQAIRVGVIYTPGADAAAKAVGISALSTGDTKAEATAVVGWINAHGGLGGHPVDLYSYAYDMSATSQAAAQQEACTAMVQDDKVRYVVSILAQLQTLTACLSKAGVGLLDDETGLGDKNMATYAPFLGNPGEFAPGRRVSTLVEDLWNHQWLTAGSKIGILAVDNADAHDAVNGPLTATLRRHGLTVTKTAYVDPNGGDGGSGASSNAALSFRAAGVDRVIPVMYSPLYFMETANSQRYQPEYAMTSDNGPGALLEAAAPQSQLKGAMGIGWQPFLDIGKGTKPGPVSPRETLCFELMKKAGQDSTSATVKGFEAQVCNVLFYLKDLADKETSVPPDLLTSGRRLLGSTFASADTFRTDVSQHTDGVAGYRTLAFEQSCTCFQYVSGVQATQ